jgi:hypothetical protein
MRLLVTPSETCDVSREIEVHRGRAGPHSHSALSFAAIHVHSPANIERERDDSTVLILFQVAADSLPSLAAAVSAALGVNVGINPIVTFKKTATEYDRKHGIRRVRCTAK